jgi:transposase
LKWSASFLIVWPWARLRRRRTFRITKDELEIRPIWHQKKERVLAHIPVCFLAYVLWKTLAQWMRRAGLGDAP